MRIFTASLSCETNTFSPIPTGLESFRERTYHPAGTHPDRLVHCAGPLWAARQRAAELGWTLVEGLVAAAMPAGTTSRLAYEQLRDQILDDLRAALPVEIVLLGLHGAMVAEGQNDCEADLLRRVREIVGPGVVVGAELDPHCHLSPDMVTQADLLVCFKEYPHTDILARAHDLVDLCAARAAGRIAPVASLVDCGMIATLPTTREPMRSFVDRLFALEKRDGILSISIAHGFPWGDVPEMGTRVLVYGDGCGERAAALAQSLADELVGLREQFQDARVDIDAAIDRGLALPDGPIMLADTADNPGGGAPGDSTFILRRFIERGIRSAGIGPLWDPGAVRLAFSAGVGACLQMRIGGKVSPLSGWPIDACCRIVQLRANVSMAVPGGTSAALGDCALVETEGIFIVLSTLRCQALSVDLFTALGCDPGQLKFVAVKSSQHFHAAFAPIAKAVLYVDTPGALSADFVHLPYRNVKLPKWPFDSSSKVIPLRLGGTSSAAVVK